MRDYRSARSDALSALVLDGEMEAPPRRAPGRRAVLPHVHEPRLR